MKHPIFHPDDEARIGIAATDPRVRGQHCTVLKRLKPVWVEHRYVVKTDAGIVTTVLELSLVKNWAKQRSDWGMLRGIWQPKRYAR